MRAGLVGLVVLATIGFVIGTTVERHDHSRESAAHIRSETESGDEASETPAAETATSADTNGSEDETLIGIDVEATPFIVLAALAPLAMIAVVWLRPRWLLGLGVVAVAMLLFAMLDVREVVHQSDDNETGLAALAAVIAALHLASAGVAALMARRVGPVRTLAA